MEERSPAQVYALVIGLTLVAAGIVGFFYSASFAHRRRHGARRRARHPRRERLAQPRAHRERRDRPARGRRRIDGARVYALGLGVVYLLVALLGFIAGDGEEILNLIPVNTEDNFLHLLIGIAGIGAGLATPAREPHGRPARGRAAER